MYFLSNMVIFRYYVSLLEGFLLTPPLCKKPPENPPKPLKNEKNPPNAGQTITKNPHLSVENRGSGSSYRVRCDPYKWQKIHGFAWGYFTPLIGV